MSPRKSACRVAFAKSALALTLIWALASGGIVLARSLRPTGAEVIAFLRANDVTNLPPAARDVVMRHVANRINRLAFEQMRKVQQSRALFIFYRPLSPWEKERFAALIVPTGLRRILDASRKLPRAERAAFLEKALYLAALDLTIAEPPIDPVALERIEKEALRTYITDLNLAERLEMEPQLQQLHGYLHPSQ